MYRLSSLVGDGMAAPPPVIEEKGTVRVEILTHTVVANAFPVPVRRF